MMTWKRWTWATGALLLCTSVLPAADIKATGQKADLAQANADLQKMTLEGTGPASVVSRLGELKAELAAKFESDAFSARDQRACADCLTPNTDLGVIGTTEWGYSISGDCSVEGKWYASFTATAGMIYHFDLCGIAPGFGTASEDVDIAITNAACTILAGVDGLNSAPTCDYFPNDFQWTAPADGTYFVKIAPYRSYNQHLCAGDASTTFTMEYYAEGNPCEGNYPVNDACEDVAPVALTAGVPVQFVGDNTCAQPDCASFADSDGNAWEAFTVSGSATGWDIKLDYCGTAPAFGNSWLNLAIGCPCSSFTAAGAYETTTCPDGNVTIRWTGIPDGTYYYPVMRDAANDAEGPYVINVVATATVPTYCASAATSTADETIKQVVLNTINNSTANCDTYDDFTAISTDLTRGASYPLTVVIGDCEGSSCYAKRARVFIDWNGDMDFADAGELAFNAGSLPNTPCPDYTVNGSITVPVDAALGCTRMRVIVREGSTDPTACGTYTWGGTEDYTVCILEAAPEGACCDGVSCTEGVSQADCENGGGTYNGDGSTCDPNPCSGACCMPDGSCSEGSEDDCITAGGSFSGYATDCDPNVCPTPGDSCANPAQIELPADMAPVYVDNNTTCGRGNNFEDPTDTATCMSYYTSGEDLFYAVTVTETVCVDIELLTDSTYSGISIDSACPPGLECNGVSRSSATDEFIPNVLLEPGVYSIMVDTWASPNCITSLGLTISPCAEGACCDNGSCSVLSAPECAQIGGIYVGDGTDCSSNPCSSGACCMGDGSCQQLTEGDCATAGGTYGGNGTLCSATVCNDACSASTVVTDGAPAAEGDNCTASATDDDEAGCQSNSGRDVWYEYTATCTGTVTMDTEGSAQSDTVLSVYDACGGTEVDCDDDSGTGNLSLVSFETIAGAVYQVRVASYSTGCGDYNLNIACAEAPQGACCNGGACSVDYELACNAAGGSYAGDGTACSGNDCDASGVDDLCDVLAGTAADCNDNATPDSCDLVGGGSTDCNANSIPDECETDCNGNGVADECDVAGGTSEDCQPDLIPDECQLGAAGRDNPVQDPSFEGGTPSAVWAEASDNFGTPLCDVDGCGDIGVVAHTGAWWVWYGGCGGFFCLPPETGSVEQSVTIPSGSGLLEFYVAVPTASGNGQDYLEVTVDGDAVYTLLADEGPADWELVQVDISAYANGAAHTLKFFGAQLGSTISNIFVDDVAIVGGGAGGGDCNSNGVPDECDIADGVSEDCDTNGVPDECEFADCDENGVHDPCDILMGADDCNNDNIPDKCQTADNDCDGNGVPDDCDLVADPDCNNNGILDQCDIDAGSDDCQPDGIPDECQLGTVPGGNIVGDPSFEAGTPNPVWAEESTNFGTPLCDSVSCSGSLFETHSGTWMVWYGGTDAEEAGSVEQSLVIPTSGTTLEFYFKIATSGGGGADWFRAKVDGNVVFEAFDDETGYEEYTLISVDISAYADGNVHTLRFDSFTADHPDEISNFFLDDVSIVTAGSAGNDCNANGVPDECDNCADLDGDGDVDHTDYELFRGAFGRMDGEAGYTSCADYDDSGAVGLLDFGQWMSCYRDYVNNPFASPPVFADPGSANNGGRPGQVKPIRDGVDPSRPK